MGLTEVALDADAPAFVVGAESEIGLVLAHGGEEDGRRYFLLAATEPRLRPIAIAAIGTGLAGRVAEWFEDLSPSRSEYLAGVEERWEAARLLCRPGSRRLLVQAARFDENVPLESARAAYESAAEPKEWGAYDCDHGAVVVHPAARADRVDFFRRALGRA